MLPDLEDEPGNDPEELTSGNRPPPAVMISKVDLYRKLEAGLNPTDERLADYVVCRHAPP